MDAKLVAIGNSRGIRIPKALLELAGLEDSVVLEVTENGVLVSPAVSVREEWDAAAARLSQLDPPRIANDRARTHPKRGDIFRLEAGTGSAGTGSGGTGSGPGSALGDPYLVLSPDELNRNLASFVMAPLLPSPSENLPFRIRCRIAGQDRVAALDRLETVPEARIGERLGWLPAQALTDALTTLRELFTA